MTMSRWLLNISNVGDSTTYQANPCQRSASWQFKNKVFTDVQGEPPVFQFVPTASCPVTGLHWEKPGSVISALSLQVLIYTDKIPLKPPLLQAEQSQLSQPGLMREVLQSFHQVLVLGSPALDSVPTGASQLLSRGERPSPSTCWQLLS